MKTKGVLVDYYTLRMVYNMRATAMKFTDELIQAGKNDMAIAVLDKVFEEMPIENSQVMADDICYYLCANYYDAGAADKGDAMAVKLAQIKLDEISYYQSQSDRFFESMHSEWGRALNMLEMLRQSSREEAQGSRAALNMQLQALQQEYQLKMEGLNEQVKTGQLDMTAATAMQTTYEGEFEAKQTSLYDSYFNQLADASKTYFNVMGPLEKTNYIEVITKSKEVYIKNRNNTKVRAIFEDPQYFPQDYLVIWDL